MFVTLTHLQLENSFLNPVTESEVLVSNCVRLVSAHQTLHSDKGLGSLPKIAREVEQYSEELRNAISSTTDR